MTDKYASPHIRWTELACHDGTPYPLEWRTTRLPPLLTAFEWIRDRCGFPICISSAYRTPAYNKAIGGARYSQHCEGCALDLMPCGAHQKVKLESLQEAVKDCRGEGLISGIGYYRDFVHIDVRPPLGGRVYTWYGSRDNTGNQRA